MQRIILTFIICLILCFASGISAQTMPTSESAQPKEKPSIAVTTFENLSAYPENAWVAMSFSEALTVKLNKLYERFKVVERVRIYEVVKEQGFDPEKMSGLETTKQQNIGSLIGANYLVLGSVSLQGLADTPQTQLMANIRTVDVQTGEIKEAVSVSGQMQGIFDLEIQLAFAFLKQVGMDITKAEEQQISIKETESLLAEKYYSLGNQYFYNGNLDSAEAWFKKAVDITEGGYHREAALKWVEVLKQQKAKANTKAIAQAINDKAGQRIGVIEQRQTEANEMFFEKAELHMIREEYELAIQVYQSYLEKAKPWQQLKWKTNISDYATQIVLSGDTVYIFYSSIIIDQDNNETYRCRIIALTKENGTLKWKYTVDNAKSSAYMIVSEDFVYLQAGNILYEIDGETGKEKWKFEAKMERPKIPEANKFFIVKDGSIYFQSSGILYAIASDTGRLKWQIDRIPERRKFDEPIFLCTIPSKFQTELDNGNLSDELRQILGNYMPLTQDAAISIEKKDNQQLINVTQKHDRGVFITTGIIIKRKSDDELNVYIGIPSPPGNAIMSIESWLFNPIISNGMVYINKYDALVNDNLCFTVVALNAETGATIWNSDMRFGQLGSPIIDSDAIYVPTFSNIVALSADNIYVPTFSNIVALSAETGLLKWRFEISFLSPQNNVYEPPSLLTINGELLYLSSESGKYMVAISTATGKVKWEKNFDNLTYKKGDATVYKTLMYSDWTIGEGSTINESPKRILLTDHVMLYRLQDTYANLESPTYTGGYTKPDKLYALSAETGEQLWESGVEGEIGSPVVYNGKVFIYSEKGLYALDVNTGKVLWKIAEINTPMYYVFGKNIHYIEQYNMIYFISSKGIHAITISTGDIIWKTEIGSIRCCAVSRDGIAYIYNGNTIFALNPKPLEYVLRPDETDVRLGIARAKRLMGKYDDAMADINQLLSSSIDFMNAYPELALCYDNMGNLTKAMRSWDRYLTLVVKPGEPMPKELAQRFWELAGLRWYGQGTQWLSGDQIDDTIYLSANDNYVYAMDSATGKIKWKSKGGNRGIAKSEDSIIITSDSSVQALNASTGQEQWEFMLIGNRFNTVVCDGVVYVQSKDYGSYAINGLYALSARTGKLLWNFKQSIPSSGYITSYPTGDYLIIKDKVYWTPDKHHLYAISKENGELKWQFDRGELAYTPEIPSPVISEKMVYITTLDGLSAINKDTGEIVWKLKLGEMQPLFTADDRFVYVATSSNRDTIYALNMDTGEIKWTNRVGIVQNLIVKKGILYALCFGVISALDVDTGLEQWTCNYGSISSISSIITITDREIYAIGDTENGGSILAISLETKKLMWRFDYNSNIYTIALANKMLYLNTDKGLYAFDLAKINQLLSTGKCWWGNSITSAKQNAILSLMPGGAPPQFKRILEILDHYDGAINFHSSDAEFSELNKMGKDAVPVLMAYWKAEARMKPISLSSSWNSKDYIIMYKLMELGDSSIVPDLESLLSYNSSVAYVLAKIQGNKAIPRLIEALQADFSANVSGDKNYYPYRNGLVQTLATLKAKEAVPILGQRLMNIEGFYEMDEITRALSNIGDPSAIPYLQDVLKIEWNKSDISSKLYSIVQISQSLCSLGDKTGIDWLIRFLEFLGSQNLDSRRSHTKTVIGALAQYTDQDFGNIDKPEEHLKEIADKYRIWWDANKDNLNWSAEYGQFALPSGWQFYRDKARSFYDKGDINQAITEYKEAIGKAKTRASQLHIELGEIYSKQGMMNEANAEYYESQAQARAMIEQGSTDPLTYNDLARFYVEKKIKPEEALSLVKKALELAPGAYMDTLGWAYCRNGQFNESLQTFYQMLSKEPALFSSWQGILEVARSDVDPDTFLQFCSKANKVIDESGVKTTDKFHWLLANFYEHRKEEEKAQNEWIKTGFPKESEWLVIGPFDNTDDKGRTIAYPPETEMNLSAIYEGKAGKVKWQKVNYGNMVGLVDFKTIFTPNEWVLAYALIDVISPDDRKVQLRIGSDDGVKVWLNSQVVWTNQVPRGLILDQDVVPVELKKGNNRILLKVDQGVGGWGFIFRITDENGKPFEDLQYQQVQNNH